MRRTAENDLRMSETTEFLQDSGDVPLGRPAQPSELGPAYVFLASDDATYITGQVLHMNGGEP